MELTAPSLTSDRVCCPRCHTRAPFTPQGRTDFHIGRTGDVCPDVFPPYVRAHRMVPTEGGRRARRP